MNILVPSAGPVTDQRTAVYIVNIAKGLGAQLVVLRVLADNETASAGKKRLDQFVGIGNRENVPVKTAVRRGEIASAIIEVAVETPADLIILGVSQGEIVAEWMNAKAMERTDIPVLLIPRWVPAAKRMPPNG